MSDDYDAAVAASMQPEPAQAARVGFAGAADTNPDLYAEMQRVARRTGVPVGTVQALPDEMKRQDRMGSIDFDALAKTSPATAALLADMDRAKLAHDDVENMSGIESALSFLGHSTLAGINDLGGAGAKLIDSINPFTLSDQDAAVLYKDQPEKLAQMRAQSPTMFLSRLARGRTEASKQNMLDISPGAQATYGNLEYATTDPSKAAYLSPVKLLGDAVRSLPTTAALALTTYLTRGAAIQGEKQALAAGATAEVAREAGIAAATNMAVKFGAASEGSIGYAQQALQTQNDIESMPLDKIGKSPEFLDLVNKGYDPSAARIFLAARAGEQAGVGAGFADAITNAIGGKFLGRIIGEGGGLLPRIGKGLVNEGVVEGVQSPFEQWFQNAATQANADPSKDLSDGLLESTLQGLFVGGLTGGAFAGAMGRAHQKEQQAQQTDQTAQLLTGLNKLAEASKLRERDSETAQGFFQSALAEGRDAVYITPDALAQSGLAEQMAQAIPAVQEQLQTAAESGHDIRIPIADLMATMAGPELEQSLIPHLATEPGGFTPTTAKEYLQSGAAQELQAEVERTLTEQEGNDAFKASAATVTASVKAQLDTAARFTPQVNDAYAAMVGNFYAVQAARTGATPEEMFAKYPLRVQADGQGGFNQDAQTHTGHKITFEVAPNPDNVALTNQWNALPAEKRLDISTEVSQSVVAKALAHYGSVKGDLHMQTGGFEDETNPSVSLWLDNSVAIATARELTRTIGYALQQKGMMLTSPKKFKGGDEWGAIVVKLGDVADDNSAKALYNELRANVRGEDGTALINGHTTDDGHMAILVPKDQAADIAQRVEDHLAGRHEVGTATMHVEWPEKGEHDYGYQTEEHNGVGAESPLRAHADQLRTEASRQLDQRIGEAERTDTGAGSGQRSEPVGGLRVGGRERLRVGNADVGARYGEPREGAGSVLGIHYSGAPRQNLDGYHYGSGLSGAEAERVAHSDDPRIKERLHFYVDSGEGIRGEAGTGQHIHGLHLENLYDTSKDPLGLVAKHFKAGDPDWLNGVESALLDADYAGILVPKAQGDQGVAVLLGKHTAQPDYLGTHDAQPESGRYVPPPTGKRTYSLMSKEIRQFEAEQAAIEAAAPSAKLKEGRLTFDEKDTDAVAQFFPPAKNARLLEQATGNSARGSFNPDTLSITLLKNADLSTFLHESGHFFLEVQADLAAQLQQDAAIHGMVTLTPGERQILSDTQALLDWFGVKSLAEWNNLDFEEQRSYHEQFARGFEAYLFEGKAPSIELQGVFQRFRAWMLNVYKSLTALNVEITDEVRGVFDRMLATTEQITLAEQGRSMMPLFTSSEQAGMTPDEFAEYHALGTDATNEAIENLQARGLRDMQWIHNARGRIIKQLQKESAARRAEVQMGVRSEVMSQPVYRAWEYLTGKDKATPDSIIEDTDGNRWSAHGRLDRASLDGMGLPPEVFKLLDALRMVKKDSLHPDIVAERFGFPSGDELVRTLAASDKPADVIKGMTDQRMLEQYGDLSSQKAIEKAADKAIHNDVRARMIATELNALAKATGQRKTLASAAKEYAAAMIARLKVRNIKPGQYASAEVRAGKAAEKASRAGELATAAAEKRNQLINAYATRAAYDAQEEVEKRRRDWSAFANRSDDKLKKAYDMDLVNAVRAILGEYGIAEKKAKRALDYLDTVKTQDPEMYGIVSASVDSASQNAKPFKDMTVEEVRGLADEIESILHLARRSRQMEIDGDLLDRRDVEDALRARMIEIGVPDDMPGDTQAITAGETRMLKFKTALASMTRAESWAGKMDGMAPFGPFRRFVWSRIKDSADAYRTDKANYLKQLRTLFDSVAPSLKPGLIYASELNYTFGKDSGGSAINEIVHAILHTGNESNLRKLLLGRRWATERPDGAVDTSRWDAFVARMAKEGKVTKAHFDFAQGVWDLLEATKPLAQKTHRDVFGKYFDEVTAAPRATPFGIYAGGYVPAQADSRIVADANLRALAESENASMAFAFPSTAKGFTKARVEYNRPLLLDLRTLSQHIDKVLLFSHMEMPVRDVQRVVGAVSGTLNRIDPAAIAGLLTPWLNRAARQQVTTPITADAGLSRFLMVMRSRAGAAAMFGNLANAVQQITGFSMAAVKVKPGLLLSSSVDFLKGPRQFVAAVAESSPFMADRMHNEVSAMNDDINQILLNPTLLESSQAWTMRHAYFLQSAIDNSMSPIIWTAAYNQALEQGLEHKDAVRLGDSAVRETQGSTLPEDVSRIESGPAWARLFTQFAGYFNMQANLLGTEYVKLMQEYGLRKGASKGLYVFTLGFLVPAVAGEMVMQAFRGGVADDDKDGEYLDDWLAALLLWAPLRNATAMIPVAGSIINSLINAWNGKPYDDRIASSPAISMLESAAKAPVSVYKAMVDGGSAQKAVRDVATLVSMTVGLPANLAARPLGYLAGVADGKTNPTGPVDATRGVVTGIASPESKR